MNKQSKSSSRNPKRVSASHRFGEVMAWLRNKKKEETGKSIAYKDLHPEYFPEVGEMAIIGWKKKYKNKPFPPTILRKTISLQKEGINAPDYFEFLDAPMFLDDKKKSGGNEREILQEILKQLKVLTDEIKKNTRLKDQINNPQ